MKNSAPQFFLGTLIFGAVVVIASTSKANTSPYVTATGNTPLNQSTTDDVNGVLPYFNSHSPVEGAISSLSDGVTSSSPTANVIIGPDNTAVGVAWDFGAPAEGMTWRLDRVDIWITGEDNLRKGFRGDLSVSSTGNVNEFTIIPNSFHEETFTQNANYNYLRYDFPSEFIAGATPEDDLHAVTDFRYLRLNSLGNNISGTDWQSRFVEVDVWVSQVPEPGTYALLAGGFALLALGRRFRRR